MNGSVRAALDAARAGLRDCGEGFDPRRVLDVDGRERPALGSGAAAARAALASWRGRPPYKAAARVLSGILRLAEGDHAAAERELAAAAKEFPREPLARLWLFRARARGNFMAGATRAFLSGMEQLDEAVRLAPEDGWVRAWRGRALKALDRLPRALADMDAAVAALPESDWARLGRANIRAELGMKREALEDCRAALARRSGEPWALAMRARVRARCADLPGCLDDLEAALALAPDFAAVLAWRGEARRQAGKAALAEKDLRRALELDSSCALAWLWLGRLQQTKGDLPPALVSLDRAAALTPENHLARCYRFEARLEAGLYAEAVADWLAFRPMRPDQFWLPRGAAGLLRSAARWTKRDPKSAWAWAWRGWALGTVSEDLSAADEALGKALALDPRHAWAAAWRGEVLYRRDGAERAASALARAAGLARTGFSLGALARAALDLGDPRRALAALDEALALSPDDNRLAAWRGEALARLGRFEDALGELTELRCELLGDAAPRRWRERALAGEAVPA